jgi:hypothetical protein
MSAPIENVTYLDGDLVWMMFAQATFRNCTFRGTARRCNFAGAVFEACTFDDAFVFDDCNIGGTTGLPERLAPAGVPDLPVRLRARFPTLGSR